MRACVGYRGKSANDPNRTSRVDAHSLLPGPWHGKISLEAIWAPAITAHRSFDVIDEDFFVLAAISFGLEGRPVIGATAWRLADDFGRAFRCGSGLPGSRVALRLGLLVADRLGLRIPDSLGQHLMQLSLGRCGRFCHFATISLSISRLP
jgi:hypothetical protein